jgi:lysophospholipase L1-like esterase
VAVTPDRIKQSKQQLLSDGLHPNNVGHELIANLVRPEFEKLLAA